eukprot:GHVU01016117.1.p2 GENE.GHVU01016117.1~~GHVU01016117.1.p2  ORF type:complete len:467 (-),score=65.38 GHVU01016117.1:2146-3546(-)
MAKMAYLLDKILSMDRPFGLLRPLLTAASESTELSKKTSCGLNIFVMDLEEQCALWIRKKRRKKMLLLLQRSQTRGAVIERQRVDFDMRTEKMIEQGIFKSFNRLDVYQFEVVLARIAPALTVCDYYSRKRTKQAPLQPADMLQLTLAWLRGGPMVDLVWIFQVSSAHAYAVAYKVCDAIRSHPDMQLTFPSTEAEMRQSASEFASLCDGNVLATCVAALDGWLCEIIAPPITKVANPDSYYSGRYSCYGVGVHLAGNAYCQVTAASVLVPGATNDAAAYQMWRLKQRIDTLPEGFIVVADAAYPVGPHVMTPFTRKQLSRERRTFNFVVSQCRIRAEMLIGMVTQRWRIFKQASQLDLQNLSKVIDTCFRLHNYVIEDGIKEHGRKGVHEWLNEQEGADVADPVIGGSAAADDDSQNEDNDSGDDEDAPYLPPGALSSALQQRSEGVRLRDDLVALVQRFGVQCP